MTYEATRRVETSVRTFTIVEHLMGAGPSRVSTIAADLEMTKGIVHNHLSTLRELGYVCKVDERYQLSPKFLSVGHRVRTASPLYRAAHDPLDSFAARLDSDVVLYAQTGRDAVVIDTHGSGGLSDTVVGTTHPLSDCLAGLPSNSQPTSPNTRPRQYTTSTGLPTNLMTTGLLSIDSRRRLPSWPAEFRLRPNPVTVSGASSCWSPRTRRRVMSWVARYSQCASKLNVESPASPPNDRSPPRNTRGSIGDQHQHRSYQSTGILGHIYV